MKLLLPKKDMIVLCFCLGFMIASLTAIAGTGRHNAKSIICQTNLAKLSMVANMRAADNDGKFYAYGSGLYFNVNDSYLDDNETAYHCPSTIKGDIRQRWGTSGTSWVWDSHLPDLIAGSYTLNGWLYYNPGTYNVMPIGRYEQLFETTYNITKTDLTPVFTDGIWPDAWVNQNDT